jgi:glycosyltransferase involved in cell wall biosynthesis
MNKITIVVPILNEESELRVRLPDFLSLQSHPSVDQILFTDSGSTDLGLQVLKAAGLNFQSCQFQGSPSVAKAIKQSTALIGTDYVLILPVDVALKSEQLDHLVFAIQQNPHLVYVFRKTFDRTIAAIKLSQFLLSYIRENLLKNFVWTNVFCVSKSDLKLMTDDGFLEDVIFCDQLKSKKEICRLDSTVTVSSRKYNCDGPWLRLFLNILILSLFRTGLFKPKRLKKLYQLSKPENKKGDTHENNSIRRTSTFDIRSSPVLRIGKSTHTRSEH